MYATIPSAGVVGALDDVVRSLTPAARACVIERLAGRGGVTVDEQTLLHVAAHVLVHDRVAVPLVWGRGTPVPGHASVIDIGGLQERHFHAVRRLFASEAADGPGALALTRHSVPPYTMARGGDIGLRAFLGGGPTGGPLASAARHDLRLLWTEVPLELAESWPLNDSPVIAPVVLDS
ncbi:hypothetical protein [Streptomyces sp. NPDC090057]|uniref:hypothetical protein n=1 Tax=Streptomyces sp. NPDC090057 TaxID=3365935 RepID=UPI00381C0C7D